jgi:hypothetical protein
MSADRRSGLEPTDHRRCLVEPSGAKQALDHVAVDPDPSGLVGVPRASRQVADGDRGVRSCFLVAKGELEEQDRRPAAQLPPPRSELPRRLDRLRRPRAGFPFVAGRRADLGAHSPRRAFARADVLRRLQSSSSDLRGFPNIPHTPPHPRERAQQDRSGRPVVLFLRLDEERVDSLDRFVMPTSETETDSALRRRTIHQRTILSEQLERRSRVERLIARPTAGKIVHPQAARSDVGSDEGRTIDRRVLLVHRVVHSHAAS